VDELAVAFMARLPSELQQAAVDGLAAELQQLIGRARGEVLGVELDPIAFVAYVAERVALDVQGRPRLRTLHAGDLWVAYGCVTHNAAALAALEQRYVPELRSALRRSFDAGLAEDAELRLMDKLLYARDDKMLASYAGRGGLASWLRAAAIRTAIDLMRARREHPTDLSTLAMIGGADDPIFAALKQRYREEFRVAFGAAAEQLTDRERALLRYRFLDGLSIDEIGVLYRVHRSTVARWIGAIREGLFEGTRAHLVDQLEVSESEIDSILRLIDSQLEFSIEALVR
jgi:RNA polymerase sigma-70 factor (ECF subfamily)